MSVSKPKGHVMTTRIGTSNFVSKAAAINYYVDQGYDGDTAIQYVNSALADGSIHTGAPIIQAGERLVLIDCKRRYAIES